MLIDELLNFTQWTRETDEDRNKHNFTLKTADKYLHRVLYFVRAGILIYQYQITVCNYITEIGHHSYVTHATTRNATRHSMIYLHIDF